MEAKEYIKKELWEFVKKFSQVRVRYEYHELSNCHFIEIIPNEVYHLNNDYLSWESEMWNNFVNLYPIEGICFISDDALAGIENAELILYGVDYAPISTDKESITFNTESILLQHTYQGAYNKYLFKSWNWCDNFAAVKLHKNRKKVNINENCCTLYGY